MDGVVVRRTLGSRSDDDSGKSKAQPSPGIEGASCRHNSCLVVAASFQTRTVSVGLRERLQMNGAKSQRAPLRTTQSITKGLRTNLGLVPA